MSFHDAWWRLKWALVHTLSTSNCSSLITEKAKRYSVYRRQVLSHIFDRLIPWQCPSYLQLLFVRINITYIQKVHDFNKYDLSILCADLNIALFSNDLNSVATNLSMTIDRKCWEQKAGRTRMAFYNLHIYRYMNTHTVIWAICTSLSTRPSKP